MVKDREGYIPARGDVVMMSFDQQAGHEQAGWRPALTVSPEIYNRASSLALFCPITSRIKGYPFEVPLPDGLGVTGVVLADQVRSLDWHARKARLVAQVPQSSVEEVLALIEPLVT